MDLPHNIGSQYLKRTSNGKQSHNDDSASLHHKKISDLSKGRIKISLVDSSPYLFRIIAIKQK